MTVTIFTKTGCPHCAGAKKTLQKQGVRFEEINVSEHPGKINELMRLSGVRKVPVIIADGKVTVGHNGGS